MFKIIANWFIHALALIIVSKIIPGINLANFKAALVAVVVISFINVLIKPILLFLTLPINILSLGLFTFVLNALLLLIAGNITPGFEVQGLINAIMGSILLSVVTTLLHGLTR